MTENKLPRKIKKQLKAAVLLGKDPRWKTSEVKLNCVKRCNYIELIRYSDRYIKTPIVGNLVVTGYSLGKF